MNVDAGSIPAASTNSGLSESGRIETKVGHAEPQVGHGAGLAPTTVGKGRTERDTRSPLPDLGRAQQEHNANERSADGDAPDVVELTQAWDQLPESVRATILVLVRSTRR